MNRKQAGWYSEGTWLGNWRVAGWSCPWARHENNNKVKNLNFTKRESWESFQILRISAAAANYWFYYRLICWLFPWSINKLVGLQKNKTGLVRNADHSILYLTVCLVLSNQQCRTSTFLLYYNVRSRKAAHAHIWKLVNIKYSAFCLKNDRNNKSITKIVAD